jgi:hypothetical protein
MRLGRIGSMGRRSRRRRKTERKPVRIVDKVKLTSETMNPRERVISKDSKGRPGDSVTIAGTEYVVDENGSLRRARKFLLERERKNV